MTATTDTSTPVHVPLVREPWGILKSLSVARRNILEIIPEIATKQPIVSGRTGKRWHMVMDPEALKHILKDRLQDYPKSDVTKNILRPAIGDSLFVAEGPHWHWQRRAAAPVFAPRNIDALAPVMSAAAEALVGRLSSHTSHNVNVFDEMVTTTFDVISDVTFSTGDAFSKQDVHHAINAYLASAAKISLLDIVGVPTWVPRPARMFGSKSMRQMKSMAGHTIEARRSSGPREVPDLLDLLLEGQDPETKRCMNTAELRDNLLTFIVAGHETTSLALSWALYLVALDQGVQDRLRSETHDVLQGRTASAKDVERLIYTRQVVEEALRLYPPAAFMSRTALKPDTLCGREIRVGDTVMLPIYALHRNALLWQHPDAFDPDRFAPGHKIDRFAYLPFGDGPRICIGARFAMTEAVIVLASVVSKLKFSLIAGQTPKPVMVLTLRPADGIHLRVERIRE